MNPPNSRRHNTSSLAACQNVNGGPANKAGISASHNSMTTTLNPATNSGANTRKASTFIIHQRLTALLPRLPSRAKVAVNSLVQPFVIRILQLLPQRQDRITLPG